MKKHSKSGVTEKENKKAVFNLLEMIRGEKYIRGKDLIYAVVERKEIKRRLVLESEEFKSFIFGKYLEKYGDFPQDKDFKNCLTMIKSDYLFENATDLAYRIHYKDNIIRYDLANEDMEYVEISANSIEIHSNSEEYFYNNSTEIKQVVPIFSDKRLKGLNKLNRYLNLSVEDGFVIMIWLIVSMIPTVFTPLMYVIGEMGTGKTGVLKILAEILDPNDCCLQNLDATNKDNMTLGLNNVLFMSYDNISSLSKDKSDILCQAITGGKNAVRKHYENTAMVVKDLRSKVAISSINDCITASDLAQRTYYVDTKPINNNSRIDEIMFWKNFSKDKPCILGDIFKGVQFVLGHHSDYKECIKIKNRLVGFDIYGYAAAEYLFPNCGGELFLEIMAKNRERQYRGKPADVKLAHTIIELLSDENHYESTLKDFYELLDFFITENKLIEFDLNELGSYLSFRKSLDRIKPILNDYGMILSFSSTTTDNISYITIDKLDFM